VSPRRFGDDPGEPAMDVQHQIVISEAELRQRIAELGQQISKDYEGRVVHCVGVLERGFIFIADLVRTLRCEVRCQFVKPYTDVVYDRDTPVTQIFYSPDIDVHGEHILLCEAILGSGLTTDFLMRHFQVRGAASVAVCTLLDRPSDRCVEVDVAYYGFRVGPQRLAGFGLSLGSSAFLSNVPYIFTAPDARAQHAR
jgi:hypoxanthine phosphoribosyltransferase